MRLVWLIGLAALVGGGEPAMAQQRPAVVELFTSQGCSSCPPADAFLGELARRPDVLALAYHVNYWDGIGWKDRFASPQATSRQEGYRRRLGLRTLYTPQMVIDGRVDLVGSDRSQAMRLLGPRRADAAPSLSLGDGVLRVELPEAVRQAMDVIWVAYMSEAETLVARGENAGRRLKEHNVVRGFGVLAKWHGEARQLTLSRADLPAGADGVAVLIQQDGQGAILGAASLKLTEEVR